MIDQLIVKMPKIIVCCSSLYKMHKPYKHKPPSFPPMNLAAKWSTSWCTLILLCFCYDSHTHTHVRANRCPDTGFTYTCDCMWWLGWGWVDGVTCQRLQRWERVWAMWLVGEVGGCPGFPLLSVQLICCWRCQAWGTQRRFNHAVQTPA